VVGWCIGTHALVELLLCVESLPWGLHRPLTAATLHLRELAVRCLCQQRVADALQVLHVC
jgi:hypothetical protein